LHFFLIKILYVANIRSFAKSVAPPQYFAPSFIQFMSIVLILIFIFGYCLIATEHSIKIDKAASALLTGVLCWVVLLFGLPNMPAFAHNIADIPSHIPDFLNKTLLEHLANIASILFFLLAAMTIVELIDVHDGFRIITDRIHTTNRVKLLWLMAWVAFFLSAVLDNMTTAIIMCALARKLTSDKETLWFLGGFIIIAANAGGAWSPIGDVTTIMLWIGGQVTTVNIIKNLFLPSAISFFIKGNIPQNIVNTDENDLKADTTPRERMLLFVLGTLSLLSVPLFKYLTHYPPFMAILFSLAVLWIVTEFIHSRKLDADIMRRDYSVAAMLTRIDTPSILFFLGILLAVAALEVSGHLHQMATLLDQSVGNVYAINTIIGLLSAVVDNVPLVAAAMGMYDLSQYPPDHDFWQLLAFCAGTGGSILIIGSAAGVASMGILKIDFMWYLKRMALYALVGYLAGIFTYYCIH
jgi:Na+/H+ antiporter NhaD/arsenite permease-like protein